MTDWIKDSIQAGLYKRPREDGNVWAVKGRVKGGSVITVTIGKEELFSATKARKEAKKILTQLAEGINPNEIKQQQRLIKKLLYSNRFSKVSWLIYIAISHNCNMITQQL